MENSPHFRLIRLILIDSYARNATVELNLEGHTALTGENGGGKTTLLRLIPLFFGESPSRVIQTDGNNHKFATHHFHSTGSYVIFEYERRGTRVLSVIHPDGQGDGATYRFIGSAFRPELFKDEKGRVQSGDLTRHLTKMGVFISKTLSLTMYRQVIQNDVGREYARQGYRELASQFSFVGSGTRLKHIERVVTSILQRATSFIDLKRMIVSSILDSKETISMQTSKRDLLHWINEYEAHHDLMAKSTVMEELEDLDQRRRSAEEQFARLHATFHLLQGHYQQKVIDGEAQERGLRKERESKVSAYNAALQEIADAIAGQRAIISAGSFAIEQLDQRKLRFANEGADGKEQRVAGLQARKDLRERIAENLRQLEGAASSVTDVYNRMVADAQSAATDIIRGQEAHRSNLLEAFANSQQVMFDSQSGELRGIRARHATDLERHNEELATCKTDEARLKAEISNPPADPMLVAAQELEEGRLKEAIDTLTNLHGGTRDLDTALTRSRDKFKECEDSRNGTLDAIERLELERDKLVMAGAAGDDTLLGFLRINKPDWASDIGRLVSEETLLRKDLAPILAEGDDFYGVSINLDKLESGRLSSEAAIQKDLTRIEALLVRRRAELVDDERQLATAGEQRKRAKERLDLHAVAIEQAKTAEQTANLRARTAKSRVKESIDRARQKIADDLQKCQAALKTAQTAFEKLKTEQSKEVATLESSHGVAAGKLRTDHNETLAGIAQTIQQEKNNLAERIRGIEMSRDAALQEKGIDPSKLAPIRNDLRTVDADILETEGLRTYVTDYRNWLDNVWPTREAHDRDVKAAVAQSKSHEIRQGAKIKERDADLEAHDRTAKTLGDAIEADDLKQRQSKGQLFQLSIWPKDSATLSAELDEAISIDVLSRHRMELQSSYTEIQARIREGVDDIRRQMIARMGTGPERCHNAIIQSYGPPQSGKEFLWIEGLRGWFAHEHTNNLVDLIQLGKTMAQNISDFWKILGHFQKEVGNFGADLKAHLIKGRLFANISDVSVNINSDVNKQNYWQSVEALHFEYDRWHAMGENTLPPASFVEAALEVATVLSDDKGLVADPVDLINLQITANIDGDGLKGASDEAGLKRMSSNGLSYLILCVIMIGFINRIRRKEKVVVPFVVDELRDLSNRNATALINLLSENDITLVSAFPDVDLDLAPMFAKNYRIVEGKKLATVRLGEQEPSYV